MMQNTDFDISEYFYIKNVSTKSGIFKVKRKAINVNAYVKQGYYNPDIEYSFAPERPETWRKLDYMNDQGILVYPQHKIYLRGNNPDGFNKSYKIAHTLSFSQFYKVGGNIFSLLKRTSFYSLRNVPRCCFANLFKDSYCLLNTPNFSMIKNVGEYGFYRTFRNCHNLRETSNFDSLETIRHNSFQQTFLADVKLKEAPQFPILDAIPSFGFQMAFCECIGMRTTPKFENVTRIGKFGLYKCFYRNLVIKESPILGKVNSIGEYGMFACFQEDEHLITVPSLANLKLIRNHSFVRCFMLCPKIKSTPKFNEIARIPDYAFYLCFRLCTKLKHVYFDNVEYIGYRAMEFAFNRCDELVKTPKFEKLHTIEQYGLRQAFYKCVSLKYAYGFPSLQKYTPDSLLNCYELCDEIETQLKDSKGVIIYEGKKFLGQLYFGGVKSPKLKK